MFSFFHMWSFCQSCSWGREGRLSWQLQHCSTCKEGYGFYHIVVNIILTFSNTLPEDTSSSSLYFPPIFKFDFCNMGPNQFYNISWVFLYFCVSGYLEKFGALKVNQRGRVQEENILFKSVRLISTKTVLLLL